MQEATTRRLALTFDIAAGFAVAMLALVGLVKARQVREALPADATLLAFALCAVLCVAAVAVRRHIPIEVAWVAAFMVAMLPALAWGFGNAYAVSKVHELLTFVPACLIAPILLLRTVRARIWFLVTVFGVAVIPAVVVIVTGVDPLHGRATVSDLNPINVARILAGAAVVAAIYAIRGRHLVARIAAGIACLVMLYAEWQTASRGPLLAAVLAVGVVVALDLAPRLSARLRIVAVAAGAVAVAVVGVLLFVSHWSPVHRDAGQSDSMRVALWHRSVELIATHPAGIGWGNLIDHLRPDEVITAQGSTQYAHNIVLEVGAEGGWIALAALLALVVVSFGRILSWRATPVDAAMLALWVFAIAVAMTSSDFTGNRLTLVMLGFGLLRPVFRPDDVADHATVAADGSDVDSEPLIRNDDVATDDVAVHDASSATSRPIR